MFNNVALDVVIGLVFIYLLYSLLATILQEFISRAFNLRARMLQKSLRKMLEDDGHVANPSAWTAFWKRLTILAFFYDIAVAVTRFFNPKWDNEKLIKKFYAHPSVRHLGEDNTSSKPAYLHSETFSQTIIQLLRGKTYDGRTENESELIRQALADNTLQIKKGTLQQMKALFYDARQDSFAFKEKLENWFDEMQNRVSGWYKKQVQVILLITGLWVAYLFNVDTIAIYRILVTNKDARKDLVQMAIQDRDKYGALIKQTDSVNDSLLKKTYQMVADDADKTNNILGLGKPWIDSVDMYKEDTAAGSLTIRRIANLSAMGDSLKTIIAKLDNQIKDSADKKDAIKKEDLLKRKTFSDSLLTGTTKTSQALIQQKQLLKERYEYIKTEMDNHNFKYSPNQTGGTTTFVGWLLTALAISLGAPFWFDLLNKFVQIRGTGPKPPPNSTADNTGTTVSTKTADGKTIRG
ncbi:MAG: hypothetical protein ABJA78_06015 [Ferruginibacter sp.]